MPSIEDALTLEYLTQAFEIVKPVKSFFRETYFEQKPHTSAEVSQREIERVSKSVPMMKLSEDGKALEEDNQFIAKYAPGMFKTFSIVDSDEEAKLELMSDGMPWTIQKMEIGKEAYAMYLDTMAGKAGSGVLQYEDGTSFDLTFGKGIKRISAVITKTTSPKIVANVFQKLYKEKQLKTGKSNIDILVGTNFHTILGEIHDAHPQNTNIKVLDDLDGYSWYGWRVLNEQVEYIEPDKAQTPKTLVPANEALMMDRGYKHRILMCTFKVNGATTSTKEETQQIPLTIYPEVIPGGLGKKLNYYGRPFPIMVYKSMIQLEVKASA